MKRLLLVSNSIQHGGGYLDHCAGEITDFLTGVARVLFVPFAQKDLDGYAGRTRARLAKMGLQTDSVHRADDPREAVARAEAIFVGGGNTFRLLEAVQDLGLVDPMRARVLHGARYVGSSAGTNLACPTVRTTNDMPIVEPRGLSALGLVPFQVNPHYSDPDPRSTHGGETREQRIREFHEENETPVVGLREGTWLRVEGDRVTLGGAASARVFVRGREPVEVAPGEELRLEAG